MKTFVTGSVALFVLFTCSSALAAGAAGGSYNWTGFYAGLNVGGAINDSKYTLSPSGDFLASAREVNANPFRTDSADLSSAVFTGGGQLGYNYQVNCFVFGFETDFNYNGVDESDHVNRPLNSSVFFPGNFIHTVTQKVDYFGTFRGRVGYTPVDRFLVYATGGLAYGHVSSSSELFFTNGGDQYFGSSSGFQPGWTVGGGGEYALSKCWSVKLEYLFIDLGSVNYTYSSSIIPTFTYTTKLDTSEHVMRLGLNYRF